MPTAGHISCSTKKLYTDKQRSEWLFKHNVSNEKQTEDTTIVNGRIPIILITLYSYSPTSHGIFETLLECKLIEKNLWNVLHLHK